MSFNRNKTLTKAQKLLQKGKIAEAVKEYQEIIDNDPSDVRTLLKVGDLQAKIGNLEGANDTYRKVAEHYAKDGFFLKAVAVFKQILKNDPGLISVYIRLAELYQQLGLNSEAMKQYQVVVRHYESQGLKKESLDVLKKMADLDPENTASRIKLAEMYAKEGHNEAASEQLKGIADGLKKKNNLQDLARVYEKMEVAGMADIATKHELSEIYLKTGEPKKALAKLQELFQADPKNPQTLELLARSFADLQQPEKSKSVYKELVAILDERGMLEERDRIKARLRAMGVTATEAPPASAEPVDSDIVEDAVIEEEPAAPAPAAPAVKAAPAAASPVKPVAGGSSELKVLQEAETLLKYGLLDKASEMLGNAWALQPASVEIRAKVVEAFGKKNDPEGLKQVYGRVAKAAEASGLMDLSNELQALTGGEAAAVEPPAETALMIDESSMEAGPAAVADSLDLEILDDLEPSAAVPETQAPAVVPPPAPAAKSPSVPKAAGPSVEMPPDLDFSAEFERSDSGVGDLDLKLDAELSEAKGTSAPGEASSAEGLDLSLDDIDATLDLSGASVAKDPVPEPVASPEPVLSDEAPPALETPEIEIDFSGMETIAKIEPPLETPEAPEPLLELSEPELEAEEDEGEEPVEEPADELEEPEVDEDDPFAAELDEAEFFVKQGLMDEAKEVLESILAQDKGHARAKAKLLELQAARPVPEKARPVTGEPERRKEIRSTKPAAILEDAPKPASKATSRVLQEKKAQKDEGLFDLASELQDEIADLENELEKPKGSDEEEYLSPEEVISEFKKGVARTVAKDDFQTHYNLGIAYKEMGLLDEAIHEFQMAAEGPNMGVDCASMTGLCLMQKRDFDAAVAIYRKALALTPPNAVETLGLNYELAEAYLGAGNVAESYKLFSKVRDIDPTFRDVRRRAKELEADMGGGAGQKSGAKPIGKEKEKDVVEIPSKKNKISYI